MHLFKKNSILKLKNKKFQWLFNKNVRQFGILKDKLICLDRKKRPEHEWALKIRSAHMAFLFYFYF
jgi:hypothetical protein